MTDLKWKSVSGYIIGRSHVSYDEPCQDRAIHFDNGELKGIVVSDGAGSCKHSEEGAIAVTNAIENVSVSQFTEWYEAENTAELMESYLLEVLHELQAQKEGSVLLDFSSTLLTVIVKGNQYLAAHVGDGVICQRINHEVSVLSHPENGRYANETYFVTMTPLRDHFRVYKGEIEQPHDFIAMTDGAAISFYVNSKREMELTNTTTLFDHLTENTAEDVQAELPEFLKLLQKNTTDDCAVAILVSHEAPSSEVVASELADQEESVFEEEAEIDDPFDDDYENDDQFDDDDYEDLEGFDDLDDEAVSENSEEQVLPRQAYKNTEPKSPQPNEIDSTAQAAGEEAPKIKAQSQALEKKKSAYVSLHRKVKATHLFKLLPKR